MAYPFVHRSRIFLAFCLLSLQEVYWNFVDEYGFDPDWLSGSGGNNMVMQAFVDGLKMQPCDPTMAQVRAARARVR